MPSKSARPPLRKLPGSSLRGALAVWVAICLGCTRPNPAFHASSGEEPPAEGGTGGAAGEEASDGGGGGLAGERADAGPDAAVPADVGSFPPDVQPAGGVSEDSGLATDVAPARDTGATASGELSSGLVAWWPLDDGAVSPVAADRSGNGNLGGLQVLSPTGAWKPGRAGMSLEVPNEVGAAVLVVPSASIDGIRNALTIAAWVYRTTTIQNIHQAVLSRQYGTGSRELYLLAFQNDTLVAWMYAGAGNDVNLRATRTAPIATWVHVALTWDGQTLRLYQDGVEVGSKAYATPMPATTNPLFLGNNANSTGLDQPLGGRLDEVRLYNRALSAASILSLMNAH